MKNQFELQLLTIGWIENLEEELDLCAHGKVLARIGTSIVSDANAPTWTVSAAALYLLRTLTLNHTPAAPVCDQLLPCCGFSMWPDPSPEAAATADVLIWGCPNGIDWAVEHFTAGVQLTTPAGEQVIVSHQTYQQAVLQFADEVEAFYQRSQPKARPADAEDAAGYEAFWREWHRRYRQFSS
ncbi:hypothetical protein [Hymenobacter actinosclerus]|nr:hypothetical protein [Hymenobacter actinosclerus]